MQGPDPESELPSQTLGAEVGLVGEALEDLLNTFARGLRLGLLEQTPLAVRRQQAEQRGVCGRVSVAELGAQKDHADLRLLVVDGTAQHTPQRGAETSWYMHGARSDRARRAGCGQRDPDQHCVHGVVV